MARRKNKGFVQHKKRVRFCSLDYYKHLVTGKVTDIEGIKFYLCNDNTIHSWYDNGHEAIFVVNEGESQLKQAIKQINAYLGGTIDGTQQQFA